MPPLGTRNDVSGSPRRTDLGQGSGRTVSSGQPVEGTRVDARNHDGMEARRPTAPDGGAPGAASPRRTISQRMGGLAKGLVKGAAAIGIAAGLLVGGAYIADVGPNLLQQIEAPAVPGQVQDPSLPGGQGPPSEIDPGPGVIKGPTLPTDPVDIDGPGNGGPGGLPQPPVDPLPTFDPSEVQRDPIPSHGGQTPSDVFGPPTRVPGSIQSPAQGIPGLGEGAETDTTGTTRQPQRPLPTFDPAEVIKPPVEAPRLPNTDPDLPGTTDPLKGDTTAQPQATLQNNGPTVRPQIDPQTLPTFKPHMLRGQ